MVQLSPFLALDVTPPPETSVEGDGTLVEAGSPKEASAGDLGALQLSLETSTAYHGYETYIEDGLICLKHKVRNLEKKKVGALEKLGGWRQPLELHVSGVSTAETGGLQKEAEQGRSTEQRSDGKTRLCGSTAALIPGIKP